MSNLRTTALFLFIRERYAIYERRVAGKTKPWTIDPILQNYRFCNVYRELDAVTQWITKNWRDPNQTDKDVWFAMAVARLFNNIETLALIGYPRSWYNVDAWLETISQMKLDKKRVFNPAYIVSTAGLKMDKVDYVLNIVLQPLWDNREKIRPVKGDTLKEFFARLNKHIGFGGFMGAQVVADVKFTGPLLMATDWMTFAVSGPGSRRGLNRVFGFAVDDCWHEKMWYSKFMELKAEIDVSVQTAGMPLLSAQDLQNCLCEFDKYERVRLGQGKPKQRYDGATA